MAQKIDPAEINAILWKACDTFRGTIDPSEYKNYILLMLALEQIEDANKEKLEGVFRNIDFNSEAALGRTKQRNERLKHLL